MLNIDTTNMCSHLQRKLFEEGGEYHRLWVAMQEDPELTAVVRSRQLHVYRNGKKVLVLAGKAAPKILVDDPLGEMLFTIRPAKPEEAGLVLDFIKRLAVYEKCADEVVADEETLYHSLFVERSAEVVFAQEGATVVGFALFFHNFSTFMGRKGLYLEDLFVLPEKRGRGYGKALLIYLAKLAVERHCGRMEWICLDWNKPALKVYRSIGAIPMDEWTVQRLTESALKEFAND